MSDDVRGQAFWRALQSRFPQITGEQIAKVQHILDDPEMTTEEVIGGPGWRDGQPPRPLGQISHDAGEMVRRVNDSAFVCGEWTREDEETYESRLATAHDAQRKLRAYIADLELRAAGVRALSFTLTPRDVFAIHAGLEVGRGIDDEEPWPGLDDAIVKIAAIVAEMEKAGAEKPMPETSAQSQAFIDGAAPWRYEADGAVDVSDDEGVLGALNAQYPPEHEAPSADATGAR